MIVNQLIGTIFKSGKHYFHDLGFHPTYFETVMAFLLLLMIILKISTSDSILLTNSSFTGTRVTSFEFQHLLQLILDGQTRITNLEQELSTLRTKNEQEFKRIEGQHKQELSSTKTDMELQLNATKIELNATKVALQDQINKSNHIGLELGREKANSHQLQLEYTKIRSEFQNMSSLVYGDLILRLANMETERNASQNSMIINGKEIASNLALISAFNVSLSTAMAKVLSNNAAIMQLQQKAGE